jgi:hypothetical protein
MSPEQSAPDPITNSVNRLLATRKVIFPFIIVVPVSHLVRSDHLFDNPGFWLIVEAGRDARPRLLQGVCSSLVRQSEIVSVAYDYR